MKRRDDLGALADGSGNALDRTGAHVADRENAARLVSKACRPWPISLPVRTKPLASSATSHCASQSVFGSAPMNRNSGGSDASSLRRSTRLRQRTVSRLPSRPSSAITVRLGQHLDIRLRPDALDTGSATCVASRLLPRASIHTFSTLAREIDRRLPRRISCADQRHFLPARKAAPRSARPNSARLIPSNCARFATSRRR